MADTILESSIIKDLSNHIYEKRKATAYQIESFTKSALAKNDSQTIYKIIAELTELTNNGTNSAKMGAITAIGSVSVALGSYAIAYFLDEIITPIFETFRDTDARVRYYACESLYNIAKIARGEILLYFNEIFDVLCILVTDTESSVKNAADILDRLIKDIVSAKSTNYVSILHQKGEEQSQLYQHIQSHVIDPSTGEAIQVNRIQDTQKAFSLPKFIPTLLERMYTIDPFAKKFLMSWLELLDDIPALELITFLPNFLEPLVKFLTNNAPSDVIIETQNLLNTFLSEIKGIQKVKLQIKQKMLEKEKLNKLREQSVKSEDSDFKDVTKELRSTLLSEVKGSTESIVEDSTDSKISIENLPDNVKSEETLSKHDEIYEDNELFLNGQDIFIDYPKIIDILLSYVRFPESGKKFNDISSESHEIYLEIQFTVLKWLQEILAINPTSFVKFFPDCIIITLKNVETTDENKAYELREQFLKFNLALQQFLMELNKCKSDQQNKNITSEANDEEEKIPLSSKANPEIDDKLLKGITVEVYDEFAEFQLSKTLQIIYHECFTSNNELARLTGLDWLIFLYDINPKGFLTEIEDNSNGDKKLDLTALLKSSSADASNEVILKVLQLLSKISDENGVFFKDFLVGLIDFFEKEVHETSQEFPAKSTLNRSKIEFIIRKLCVTLDSEKIFKTISEVLSSTENLSLEFLDMMTITLNNILLTAQELNGFRKKMKNLDLHKSEDWSLFATLFLCFCNNAPSALSLCLLTSNYELSFLIITELCESEITYQLLTQLDILVQLLESPIFVKLRLQLLDPEKNPYLYKTLYGLLMILPQSSTFTALKNRLSSVSHTKILNSTSVYSGSSVSTTTTSVSSPIGSVSSVTNQLSLRRKRIYEMLEKFTKTQEHHEKNRQKPSGKSLSESTLDEDEHKKEKPFITPIERKDTFGDKKIESKRKTSGRFGLSRFNS